MPSELRSPRLAVLIDADNASAKIVDGLFEEIAKIGEASVRRIYGDFSNPRSKGWADTLSKHAIIPQQQFAYTTGKNASDITLVIDAMDLLHSGRFDGFCLVSSDSDFTRLAARIREPRARRRCSWVRRAENSRELPAGLSKVRVHREPAYRCCEQPRCRLNIKASSAPQRSHAHHKKGHHADGKRRRVGASEGSRKTAANLALRLRSRTFGFRKLSDLVRRTNSSDIDHPRGGSMRISHKVRCRITSEIEDRHQKLRLEKSHPMRFPD